MGFKDFGSKLKSTWVKVADKTADAYEATVDAVKDSGQFAIDLQSKALQGKIETAALSWDAIYVDEMLDGTKDKSEDSLSGADILKSIEEILVEAQANITTIGSGKKVANVVREINKALDIKLHSAQQYSLAYDAISKLSSGLDELGNDDKTQKALLKQGNAESFANLVGMFDFNARCEAVLIRGNFEGLIALASSDNAAKVLSINEAQRGAIEATNKVDTSAKVDAARFVLDVLKQKASYIYVVDDELTALSDLNSDTGSYNLSLSVPKNAAALSKHYGNQMLSSTVDYTGRAVAVTGKASSWIKDHLKKEPK